MAITKIFRIVEDLTSSKVFAVKGFRSAKLTVDVTAITGTRDFGFYGVASGTASASSPQIPINVNGVLQPGFLRVSETGLYEIGIDLTNISSLFVMMVNSTDNMVTSTQVFSAFNEPLILSSSEQEKIFKQRRFTIDVRKAKQIEIDVYSNMNTTVTGYVYVEGSVDGNTYSGIGFYDMINNTARVAGENYLSVAANTAANCKIFANVEDYNYIRLRTTGINSNVYCEHRIFENYKKELGLYYRKGGASTPSNYSDLSRGYKYAKFEITTSVAACLVTAQCRPLDANGNVLKSRMILRNNKPLTEQDSYQFFNGYPSFNVCGNIEKQFVYIELLDDLSKLRNWQSSFVKSSISSISTSEIYDPEEIKLTLMNELPKFEENVLRETNDYKIISIPTTNVNRDVYNSSLVVEWTATALKFKQFGDYGVEYNVPFDSTSVPDILPGEQIEWAYLLPAYWSGGANQNSYNGKSVPRCCVFTNKSRVLHNFPDRYVSGSKVQFFLADMCRFAESEVSFDLSITGAFNAVNDKGKVTATKKYLPIFAEYNYSQFDGRIGGTNAFGAQQPSADKVLLAQNIAGTNIYSKLTYSNIAKDDRICVFGNYNAAAGQEPFIMSTGDGGKTWIVKHIFSMTDNYTQNSLLASKITFTPITSATPFVANSLKLCRRKYNHPTEENKEPANPFIISENEQSLITGIGTANGTVQITTADDLLFENIINPICFIKNISATGDWGYICNDVKENGSDNTGVYFSIKRTAAKTYELYQLAGEVAGGANFGKNVVRHIHAVNRVGSGYLVSTGESRGINRSTGQEEHQGGDLYFVQDNMRDGASYADPATALRTMVRLTSTVKAVNRVSGAYLVPATNNDADVIVASDMINYVERNDKYVVIPGRTTQVKLVAYGIFKGKLSDIDDFSKFECICDASMVITALVHNRGHFVAEGHNRIGLFISADGEKWYQDSKANDAVNGVDEFGNIFVGDKMIIFK